MDLQKTNQCYSRIEKFSIFFQAQGKTRWVNLQIQAKKPYVYDQLQSKALLIYLPKMHNFEQFGSQWGSAISLRGRGEKSFCYLRQNLHHIRLIRRILPRGNQLYSSRKSL